MAGGKDGGADVALVRGGEEGGTRVREDGLDGGGGVVLGGLGFGVVELEAGEDVAVGEVVAGGSGSRGGGVVCDGQVDHLEHLVFGDGLEATAGKDGFHFRVVVDEADFGDDAETEGGSGQALCAPEAGEVVEEGVGGAVVGFGGAADGAGDGADEEEEVQGRIASL